MSVQPDHSVDSQDSKASTVGQQKLLSDPVAAQACIGLDKSGYQVNIFLISPQKTYIVDTHEKRLSASMWGTSNTYPQHMFSWRNKKKIIYFWIEKSIVPRAMDLSEALLAKGTFFHAVYPFNWEIKIKCIIYSLLKLHVKVSWWSEICFLCENFSRKHMIVSHKVWTIRVSDKGSMQKIFLLFLFQNMSCGYIASWFQCVPIR